MSKTTIKELALSLSEKHDLSKADAERFVATIFEVINDGLEDDKLVKVKGLGAFKIIGVAARKSVDVNTGEPIVIEGRNKISFTPDASMRDDVNKPFSQFETVIINDGVDFSSIDKEYENENENETVENEEKVTTDKDDNKEQEKTENEISKDTETLIKSEPGDRERLTKDHSQEMPLSTESDPAAKNDPPTESVTPAESGSSAESDIPAVKDETPAESETSTVNKETPAEEETSTVNKETPAESKSSAEVDFATERRDIEREVEKELINYKETHPSHAMKVLAITAVVFVIACLCGGYYLFSQIQRRDSHIEMLEKQMRMVTQQQKEKKVATKPSKQIPQAKQDTLPQETDGKQDDAKLMPQADSKQETLKAADKQTALQDQYNKDVRIRTGAYVIVGIKKTVTVRSGQTMEGISRSNLGPGMECYLEAVNGGKRELKAGESLNIPELKLKKRLR